MNKKSDAQSALMKKRQSEKKALHKRFRNIVEKCIDSNAEYYYQESLVGKKPIQVTDQELFFFHRYNEISHDAFTIYGPLNIKLLLRSFNTLVQRHDILNTVFREKNGELFRATESADWFSVKEVNLYGASKAIQKTELQKEVETHSTDITSLQHPLLRVTLFQLNKDHCILLTSLHHIICDRTTFSNFYKELSQIYSAYLENKPVPLKPLPAVYNDFLHAQQLSYEKGKYRLLKKYWEQRLDNLPQYINLPTDRPASTGGGCISHNVSINIDDSSMEEALAFARNEGITFFIFAISVLSLLGFYFSKQDDIFITYINTARTRPQYKDLLGNFVNYSVFRSKINDQLTIEEFLSQAKKDLFKDQMFNQMPFLVIKKIAGNEPGLEHNYLRQIGLNVLSRFEFFDLPGIDGMEEIKQSELKQYPNEIIPEPVDGLGLNFRIASFTGGGSMLAYNTVLYDKETAEQIADCFCHLLKLVTQNPTLPISALLLKLSTPQVDA